jgi:hypothetical protein
MGEEGKAEQTAEVAAPAPNADPSNKRAGRRNRQQRNKTKWKDNTNTVAHVPKEKFTGRSDEFIYDISNSRGGVTFTRTTEEIARHVGEKYTTVGPYVRTGILTLKVPVPTRPTAPIAIPSTVAGEPAVVDLVEQEIFREKIRLLQGHARVPPLCRQVPHF